MFIPQICGLKSAPSTANSPQDPVRFTAYIPRMNEDLVRRIDQRLEKLNKTRRGASLEAGLSPDFIRNLARSPDSSPKAINLARLARVLSTTDTWLLHGTSDEEAGPIKDPPKEPIQRPPSEPGVHPPTAPEGPKAPYIRAETLRDFPVLGTAAGSLAIHQQGGFEMETRVIEYVWRPPAFHSVPSGYAIYVTGSSMEPKFYDGDLVFVHPHKPPRPGDTVVIQSEYSPSNGVEAYIGDLVRRTSDKIIIRKLNPESEIEFNRQYVKAMHRVLRMGELFGA